MFVPVDSPYLVPYDGSFRVADAPTTPPDDAPGKKGAKKRLAKATARLKVLQRKLYADDKRALLLVFQAMDAAGKDSTIRAVMSGINPAGCQVYCFKQPSSEEQDHDFLWRTAIRLPERGRIGIFNRSYYESTLVVRVHPEYLAGEKLPWGADDPEIWEQRHKSIREHERHLWRNGTVVLKFWLNVSKDEQKQRFLDRIEDPAKNWKFSSGDLVERKLWPKYMEAYEDMLSATSRRFAPWYAIPADNKPFMRLTVSEIVADTLESLDLAYPTLSEKELGKLSEARRQLEEGA